MSKPESDANSIDPVTIFAALGDETRATLVRRLSDGRPQSISQLGEGLDLTRQGVTKHLRVLQRAGLVVSNRHGREMQFVFVPSSIHEVQDYLKEVSAKWDAALSRLKSFVEDPRH